MSQQFDDSGMTQPVAEAYRRVLAKYPSLPKVKAVIVNPALRQAKLWGQYVDGVIEVNPDMTNVDQLERLLVHELEHAAGGDETKATQYESIAGMSPVPSHYTAQDLAQALQKMGLKRGSK